MIQNHRDWNKDLINKEAADYAAKSVEFLKSKKKCHIAGT